jgi:hypothetical protein
MSLNSISIIAKNHLPLCNPTKENYFTPNLEGVVFTVYVGKISKSQIRKLKWKATTYFLHHQLLNFIARIFPAKG